MVRSRGWKEKGGKINHYNPPQDRLKSSEAIVKLKGFQMEDMLVMI